MKLVIGGVAQGKLDYVLENMIEESEKYDVYDCFFLKDNACNDKASNMEWPWDFADLNDTTAIPLKHLEMKKPAQKTINA